MEGEDFILKDVLGLFDQYVEEVTSGKQVACVHVKDSVARHLRDLEAGEARGIYFDRAEARRVMEIVCHFRHTKGSFQGRYFDLQPFQAFILGSLFGWRKKATGKRRFKEAYIEMARKGAKSELGAAIALLLLIFDEEKGAEVTSAATTSEQAHYIFDAAHYMATCLVEDSEVMADLIDVTKYRITIPSNRSFMKALSKDRGTGNKDGGFPHGYMIDEFHAHPDDSVLSTGRTGRAGRSQAMIVITTTAGTNIGSVCFTYRTMVTQVLNGTIENDDIFGIIYTLDEDDFENWTDPATWVKPNPLLGASPTYEDMEGYVRSALTEGGSTEVAIKTKNFNLWTTTHSFWISDHKWQRVKFDVPYDVLKGLPALGGLDLAQTFDLAAYTLTFDVPGEVFGRPGITIPYQKYYFWCPLDTIKDRSRRGRADYIKWADQKLIRATPGEAIDHEKILTDILELNDKYNIVSSAYDRALGDFIISKLVDANMTMNKFQQTITEFNMPTKELARRTAIKELYHEDNIVQRWQMGNVLIYTDSNANQKIDKGKSVDKVDGPVSAVMSLGEYMTYKISYKPSVYETRGVVSMIN